MASVKKRKLNAADKAPALSAVAARRLRSDASQAQPSVSQPSPSKKQELSENSKDDLLFNGADLASSKDAASFRNAKSGLSAKTPKPTEPVQENLSLKPGFGEEQSGDFIPIDAAATLPRRPNAALSKFLDTEASFRESKKGEEVTVESGERLVVLGEYRLTLKKGQVSILGATLSQKGASYQVYAPASHSLPVIRNADSSKAAVVELRSCQSNLPDLAELSPLYGRIWASESRPNDPEKVKSSRTRSFEIVFGEENSSKQLYIQPVISPPQWNAMLHESMFSPEAVNLRRANVPSTFMICGPKSSGKSTFTKLLINQMLTTNIGPSGKTIPEVALLDIDPGQPEYSIPGQVSLICIQEPNFGPPFTHPNASSAKGIRVIRAHSTNAISPSADPEFYMACILDLLAHYRQYLKTAPLTPLVVNTPGWILGTGLMILTDLLKEVQPTSAIYMSEEGPPEVVSALREANKPRALHTLPSQMSEYTTRISSQLRAMQTMSYFHLAETKSKDGALVWNKEPLSSLPPLEVTYAGEGAGIMGILCQGDQPPADMLADAINGTILSVVVIEDKAAFADSPLSSDDQEILPTDSLDPEDPSNTEPGQSQPQTPLIIHTEQEELPYFDPTSTITLNPKYCHSIGYVLLRGIDVARRQLQVITPISLEKISNLAEEGKQIILVSGKLETPGWAYQEDLNRAAWLRKSGKALAAGQAGVEEDSDEVMENAVDIEALNSEQVVETEAPWLEQLKGDQGRGAGGRVWRVRRDLGKNDGGD